MKRYRIIQAMLASGSLLLVACSPEGPLSNNQTIALRQVSDHVPNGASEARAKLFLTDRGFQLSGLSSDQAANHLMLGTYSKGDRLWQVGLIIIDGKVAGSSVTITDTGGRSR